MAKPGKNWLSKMQSLEGAVVGDFNPFNHTIQTGSPSLNFCFGNTHGLPQGYSLVLFGNPKGGKSVIVNSSIGQLHHDDSESWAVKFDTEFREQGQLTPEAQTMWGIDKSRYQCFSVNNPELVFDRIEQELAAMCQDGLPLKLVVIDSITGIQGRRSLNAESIMKQQIGDHALTVQEGLKRILPIQRKYKFSVILTAQVRAEMDMWEIKRGNKTKMSASFGVQHYAEYFMSVGANLTADGKTDLEGNKLENEKLTDSADKSERTGHKIKVQMRDSSCGVKGRCGEFTFDYKRGIINQHEEVFILGRNRNIIQRPNNTTYAFGDRKWVGAPAMIAALKDDTELYKAVLFNLKKADMSGAFKVEDAKVAEELDSELGHD